ncbi:MULTISPECIES: hypothetical protein [Bacillaceae]|uniref:hypothetical protein n=1 Tax=Bacillaceae TaxID=186817 RepID=UPI001404DC3A|nr:MULTISPECIES: hypothetical protein [Bacillaceae]MDT2047312.1 hypothetical protein [Priestia flexa]USY56577.1 hypothetical protein NIZ91_07960 [Bacillus sp. 1780r2a1]
MKYEFNKEVQLLLVTQSDDKVKMVYIHNSWSMPKIGPRPPYYCYPNYKMNKPVI